VLGYLGPEGTFTHQALLSFHREEARPYSSVIQALDAVRNREVESVLVPLENSMEGGVSATLDNLASGQRLMITREVLLDVQFDLCVRPGTKFDDIRHVITHPHAAAQTRNWIAQNLPKADLTEGGSTAAAAKEVSNPDSKYDAAVCAAVAGDLYGLDHIARNIADNPGAVTRFVLVGLPGRPPAPTGSDKTTLAVHLREDQPGALLEMLQQFAMRGVNLCRIESRPTKEGLGSYYFSIDVEAHILDARMRETAKGLHRIMGEIIFLGSYPRADHVRPKIGRGFSDKDFKAAKNWFIELVNPEERR
jgi:prephenate dehydratase